MLRSRRLILLLVHPQVSIHSACEAPTAIRHFHPRPSLSDSTPTVFLDVERRLSRQNLEGHSPLHVYTLNDDLTISMLDEESTLQIKPVKNHIDEDITGVDLTKPIDEITRQNSTRPWLIMLWW